MPTKDDPGDTWRLLPYIRIYIHTHIHIYVCMCMDISFLFFKVHCKTGVKTLEFEGKKISPDSPPKTR